LCVWPTYPELECRYRPINVSAGPCIRIITTTSIEHSHASSSASTAPPTAVKPAAKANNAQPKGGATAVVSSFVRRCPTHKRHKAQGTRNTKRNKGELRRLALTGAKKKGWHPHTKQTSRLTTTTTFPTPPAVLFVIFRAAGERLENRRKAIGAGLVSSFSFSFFLQTRLFVLIQSLRGIHLQTLRGIRTTLNRKTQQTNPLSLLALVTLIFRILDSFNNRHTNTSR
jgi:hypothetical protein